MKTISETLKYATGLAKIWDQKTPAQLIFFVTNRCNSKCRHCFYWKSLNKGVENELSLEEIKKISRSMGQIFWLFISGGEPFLREDLAEICEAFYKNNKPRSIVIPTNGLLIEKIIKDVERIANSCSLAKIVVQISIDDVGERHDMLRGIKGNFAKIEKLVPRLKDLQLKYKNLALQANIVFTKYNQDRIIEIYDYIYNKFRIDNICVSLVRGEPREIGVKDIDFKKYAAVHNYMKKTKRFAHYNPILSFLITKKEDMQIDVFLKSFKEKRVIVPCLAARQTAVLYPNGDLSVCELRREKFGNFREVNYDFNKLWQSKKARELRKAISGCYCTQECVYTPNIFLNPRVWPMFLKYLAFGKI